MLCQAPLPRRTSGRATPEACLPTCRPLSKTAATLLQKKGRPASSVYRLAPACHHVACVNEGRVVEPSQMPSSSTVNS